MQEGLFTAGPLAIRTLDAPRVVLGRGAWIQHVPHFLDGQRQLFHRLRDQVDWEQHRRRMYDRVVDVPRLLGRPPLPLDPILADVQERLAHHTGWTLDRIGLALYRDGQDSVAWHGDKMGELRTSCVMAILSLGATRRFLLRPAGGGASRTVHVQGGDLLVLGGTIHETFEHAVPKEVYADPRIAVMFRPSSGPGDVQSNM